MKPGVGNRDCLVNHGRVCLTARVAPVRWTLTKFASELPHMGSGESSWGPEGRLWMKVRSAAIAAIAAGAIGAGTLAPGASAWDECPPGNDNPQYCEHHHHRHDWGSDPWGYFGRWGASMTAARF